jgi:hypothetical protein
MPRHLTPLRPFAAACTLLAAIALPGPPGASAQKKKDPDVTRYMKLLMARFESWDKNSDNTLDKDELAKAFRGAKAKAYDYQPETKESKARDRALLLYAALTAASSVGGESHHLGAEIVVLCTPRPASAPPVNPNLYADYQFLVIAGTKGQSKLSRKEFETWARSYAKLLDEQEEAQQHVSQAKAKQAKAKTEKAKVTAAAEVGKYAQQFQTLTNQLNAIPPAIHKTLNVKG